MAQSQNSSVDLTLPATCLMGLTSQGNVMLGNNTQDYIQIPWTEIDYVAAEVLRGTKKIPRFVIFTKDGNKFTFSTRENKKTLRCMGTYIGEDKLLRSPDVLEVVGAGVKSIPHALGGLFHKDK